ncbi:putative anti-sigma factor [Sphingobacterium faecium PCAi_F2.5]|nr:putative anti-sigma factor [Sphingobacterium faecium PCAi_F2.5]
MLESWYISEVRSNKDYQGLEENLAKLDQNFMHIIGAEEKKGFKLWPSVAVAASFFTVLGLSLYFYSSKSPDKVELANVAVADINPAGNKAYLTLGNGKRIALTDASNGTIAEQTNVQITKTADGQLVYTIAENKSGSSSPLEYNTIETPNGGRYEIALPDGTHVWMNAASSLKYPASFASLKVRRVELHGEAYFQVAKDKQHPFIVKTAQQEVKVLGTHFNINSYADEPEVKTTLLEGSVNVLNLKNNSSKILRPGQQAIVTEDVLKVGDADVDQSMSWKNGDFVFVGEDLKAVMRQVARWYDVEIEYQGNINSSGVVSTISRTKKLSQVLKALQINQGIHFKVEGRRVLVMP